jgi:Bardet-Biedl syndrome 2 protein
MLCCIVDGKTPSLACATTGGKVLLHSPHDMAASAGTGQLSAVRFLNLNRKITALAAGNNHRFSLLLF